MPDDAATAVGHTVVVAGFSLLQPVKRGVDRTELLVAGDDLDADAVVGCREDRERL
jgi:hypothetical protein